MDFASFSKEKARFHPQIACHYLKHHKNIISSSEGCRGTSSFEHSRSVPTSKTLMDGHKDRSQPDSVTKTVSIDFDTMSLHHLMQFLHVGRDMDYRIIYDKVEQEVISRRNEGTVNPENNQALSCGFFKIPSCKEPPYFDHYIQSVSTIRMLIKAF